MLAMFKFMDETNGDSSGCLTLDEWLGTMGKVGLAMSDEQFETDIMSMLRASRVGGGGAE